jgi:hypothetical protein
MYAFAGKVKLLASSRWQVKVTSLLSLTIGVDGLE